MEINQIPYPHVRRAINISIVGMHPIRFVGHNASDAHEICMAHQRWFNEMNNYDLRKCYTNRNGISVATDCIQHETPCKCGNYYSNNRPCSCEWSDIQVIMNEWHAWDDIVVIVPEMYDRDIMKYVDSLPERDDFIFPDEPVNRKLPIGEHALEVLRLSFKGLLFRSLKTMEKVVDVSRTISHLAGEEEVSVVSMAEAVTWVPK